MTGCKLCFLPVRVRRRASGLSVALPLAKTFFSTAEQEFCRLRHAGTLRSDSLGCRPRAPIIRDGTGPRVEQGFTRFRKNFWRKISKFLVGEEAFSDPTSIIIRISRL